MTKQEAIKAFVEQELNAIPQDWVQTIAEAKHTDIYAWPMWGTMWIVDEYIGKPLMEKSILFVDPSECENHDADTTCQACEEEEMRGAHCITDKNGETTRAFIYEIDGQYLIGVHGAGWNFYDGVWDEIYNALGMQWHDEVLSASKGEEKHHDPRTCENSVPCVDCEAIEKKT